MKRNSLFLFPALVMFVALTGAYIQTTDTCDTKTLKDDAKAQLDPYTYDSGKVTRLYYKKKDQLKEIEIPVFVGEKYKFVFNTAGISRAVTISIYNKDKDVKGRKEIFSMKTGSGDKIQSFTPEGAKFKFFVDYSLPAVSDSMPPSECMVMMLGYK
ncbi:MAG: hypothetical protein HY064_12585 [Bacteroidetes bacterium]|nr:hypothetical protein [Bacteroidota bacterium]